MLPSFRPLCAWTVEYPSKYMFHDACLLTYELRQLHSWLENLALRPTSGSSISFLEPNLRFVSEEDLLKVYFELEARPGWRPADGADMNDFWIEFPLSELDLQAAVLAIRTGLAEFPQRGVR